MGYLLCFLLADSRDCFGICSDLVFEKTLSACIKIFYRFGLLDTVSGVYKRYVTHINMCLVILRSTYLKF